MTKEVWLPKYSEIIKEHDSRVQKGEVEMKTFDSKEELFSYLHKQ